MSNPLSAIIRTSAVAQSQDFLDVVYLCQSTATGATPGKAKLVPGQQTASLKTWIYETGSAASGALPLTALEAAVLIDADDGPVPNLNSSQPGYYASLTPGGLASLRSGVVSYFGTAATVPAQSIAFVLSGLGATKCLGVEVEVIANSGSGTDFIASGASSATYFYPASVVLADALYPIGAGGALVGPTGSVISAGAQPLVVAQGAVFGVVPRPAAASAGDIVKITVLVKI